MMLIKCNFVQFHVRLLDIVTSTKDTSVKIQVVRSIYLVMLYLMKVYFPLLPQLFWNFL